MRGWPANVSLNVTLIGAVRRAVPSFWSANDPAAAALVAAEPVRLVLPEMVRLLCAGFRVSARAAGTMRSSKQTTGPRRWRSMGRRMGDHGRKVIPACAAGRGRADRARGQLRIYVRRRAADTGKSAAV